MREKANTIRSSINDVLHFTSSISLVVSNGKALWMDPDLLWEKCIFDCS